MDEEFTAFARARYTTLVRRAYLMTGDVAQAEDLVQHALVGLLLAWRRTRIEDPDHYMTRALANARISNWRRHRGRELLTSVVPERPAPEVSPTVVERDELMSALREVPPKQRTILVLRYYENRSDEEIAHLLGVAESTVRSQAARGLQRLRRSPLAASTAEGIL